MDLKLLVDDSKNNKFQSGKTAIANFLSESINVEEVNSARPTQGVRIVEFALSHLNINEKQCKVDIEMWDCSGDHRYIIITYFVIIHF